MSTGTHFSVPKLFSTGDAVCVCELCVCVCVCLCVGACVSVGCVNV